MGAGEALFFSIVYTAGILGTFGHLYRAYQGQLRPRHLVYVLLWPLWWICAKGVGGTFDALSEAFWGSDARAGISLAIGVFTAGDYLVNNWSGCGGAVQCGGVALKGLAMTAPQIAGLYWAWVLSLAG